MWSVNNPPSTAPRGLAITWHDTKYPFYTTPPVEGDNDKDDNVLTEPPPWEEQKELQESQQNWKSTWHIGKALNGWDTFQNQSGEENQRFPPWRIHSPPWRTTNIRISRNSLLYWILPFIMVPRLDKVMTAECTQRAQKAPIRCTPRSKYCFPILLCP